MTRLAGLCASIVVMGVLMFAGLAQAQLSRPLFVMQEDPTIVDQHHNRDLALRQFKEMGGTNVRINLNHACPAPTGTDAEVPDSTMATYEGAIKAIKGYDLTPQVTLVWCHQTDPQHYAAWVGSVVQHLNADPETAVHIWSVLNEPDETLPAADSCDPETIQSLVHDGTLTVSKTTVRVKQYLFKVVRRKRGGKVFTKRVPWYEYKRVQRVVRGRIVSAVVRKRKFRFQTTPVQRIAAGFSSHTELSVSLRQGCIAVQRGRIYHRMFGAAEPVIRQWDRSATVLAGETSSNSALSLFVQEALPLHANGWAHHAYQWDLAPDHQRGGYGIGDLARVVDLVGMPVWVTEFAYAYPGSAFAGVKTGSWFNEPIWADWLGRACRYGYSQGAVEMAQYGWFGPAPGWGGSWYTPLQPLGDDSRSSGYWAIQACLSSM